MNILRKINVGTCYYPDHWPRENWQRDLGNMLDMGLSVVRVAELSWAAMEPGDGDFVFDWLEDFVGTAGKAAERSNGSRRSSSNDHLPLAAGRRGLRRT
jgi:hypothetical protein